jgi:glyoxylase-like metal-dependent hydrolase (beta-lactamase superfamily II)/ferredoxin
MADPKKRLPENVEGVFFVDSSCINCDTCRQLAPGVFMEAGDFSVVSTQPRNVEETRQALRALVSCPTGSIGTRNKSAAKEVMADFPLPLEGGVFYCGFNSQKSFGGNSYFIQHPDGNWLIDSPKFLPVLIQRFRELGGIRYIFLTHRDDVAEAARFAQEFSSERIIHQRDLSAQPDAEIVLDGIESQEIHPDFLAIPTPGHTAGHMVLLYRNRFLFTGDHLWWNPERERLGASRSVCWYSWPEQIRSMERLLDHSFEWVIPGHGSRVHLTTERMNRELSGLVTRMKQPNLK